MSCKTSEADLRDRQAWATKNNYGWIPGNARYDAKCPYCGVYLAFEYDYEGCDDTEEECPACGETFDLYIEWEPTYECTKRRATDAD